MPPAKLTEEKGDKPKKQSSYTTSLRERDECGRSEITGPWHLWEEDDRRDRRGDRHEWQPNLSTARSETLPRKYVKFFIYIGGNYLRGRKEGVRGKRAELKKL